MLLRKFAVPLFGALVFSSSCRQSSKEADTSAVDTANTSVRSQGQIGFCWAYAAIAMIESKYKARTGKDIDLSEEALGFFYFAEQLQRGMDKSLASGQSRFSIEKDLQEGNFIGSTPAEGMKGAFDLVKRWGVIPESTWSTKFSEQFDVLLKKRALSTRFEELRTRIQGKQRVVQMNQIFELLKPEFFPSLPPVDGFDNGSGQMNAVKYAEQVIGFNASDFRDVVITKSNSNNLGSAIAMVKESLARGLVVGIGISMPAGSVWGQKIQGTKFVGHNRPFLLEGGHAMVITDFKNQGGTFGKAPDIEAEVKKDIEPGLQFRLKNSWGSQSGFNEFGKAIQTGFYDMDLTYMTDVLQSNGFIIFTLIR